jgi:DNA-binding transcriptional ArsR family regulator
LPARRSAGTRFARRAQILQALSHPVRVGILERLAATETAESPRALVRDLGDVLQTVAYHVRLLAEAELIILDRIEPKYGTVEHFYRLTADGERALAIVRLLDESLYLSL